MQFELRRIDLVDQIHTLLESFDEHAWLRLDEQGDILVISDLFQTLKDAVH